MRKIESFGELLNLPVQTIVCLQEFEENGLGIISPDHIAYKYPLFSGQDEDGPKYLQCHFITSILQSSKMFRIYANDFEKYQLFVMEQEDIKNNKLAQYLNDQKPVSWFSRMIIKIIMKTLQRLKERITGVKE